MPLLVGLSLPLSVCCASDPRYLPSCYVANTSSFDWTWLAGGVEDAERKDGYGESLRSLDIEQYQPEQMCATLLL